MWRCFVVLHEQTAIRCHGNDHDGNVGFDLEPEVDPNTVDRAVGESGRRGADDLDDHGEDA